MGPVPAGSSQPGGHLGNWQPTANDGAVDAGVGCYAAGEITRTAAGVPRIYCTHTSLVSLASQEPRIKFARANPCAGMSHSVLMASASPKLLIEDACLKLQVKHVIGTELIPYKGLHIIEKNCPRVEKLNQIKGAFHEHHLAVAFSDNEGDMELLHQAHLDYWVLSDGNIRPC